MTNTTTTTNKWKFPSRRRSQTLGFDALERISHLYHQHQYHEKNDTKTAIRSSDDDERKDKGRPVNPQPTKLHRIDTCIASLSYVSQKSGWDNKIIVNHVSRWITN